jgi:hypothetical protein
MNETTESSNEQFVRQHQQQEATESSARINASASGPLIRDGQGFVKPALPARLNQSTGSSNQPDAQPPHQQRHQQPHQQPQNGPLPASEQQEQPLPQVAATKRLPPLKDPAARAAGAQARAQALAAAGLAIVRPTTAQVEESYEADDHLFASISMDTVMFDDPSMGFTSSDMMTAMEADQSESFGFDDTTLVVDDGITDGFGMPPPAPGGMLTSIKREPEMVKESIMNVPKPNSAGAFVFPQVSLQKCPEIVVVFFRD